VRERGYFTAQVCPNGHVVTQTFDATPQHSEQFCTRCGAKTLTACLGCGEPIRGAYQWGTTNLAGEPAGDWNYRPPSFCPQCGRPYPWTETSLKAARELADETEELSSDEREQLKRSLDDLVTDTPRTGLAIVRFKKLATKGGQVVAQGLKQILVSVVTEAVRKQIWPS